MDDNWSIPFRGMQNMKMSPSKYLAIFAGVLLFALAQFAPASFAQLLPEAKPAESSTPVDPLGRTNPRGTVEGYLRSIRAGEIEKATR